MAINIKYRPLKAFLLAVDSGSFTGADRRQIGLIEQVLLPALKSNRPERRREGLEQLDDIVQATTQLRQLLLARGVRRFTGGPGAR